MIDKMLSVAACIVTTITSLILVCLIIALSTCERPTNTQNLDRGNSYIVTGMSRPSAYHKFKIGDILSITNDSLFKYSLLNQSLALRIPHQDSTVFIDGENYIITTIDNRLRNDGVDSLDHMVYVDNIRSVDIKIDSLLSSKKSLSLDEENKRTKLNFYDYTITKGDFTAGGCLQVEVVSYETGNDLKIDIRGLSYGIYNGTGLVIAFPDENLDGFQFLVVESKLENGYRAKSLHSNSRIGFDSKEYILSDRHSDLNNQIDSTLHYLNFDVLKDKVYMGISSDYNQFRSRGGIFFGELEECEVNISKDVLRVYASGRLLIDDTYHIDSKNGLVIFDNQCEFSSKIIEIEDKPYFTVPILVGSILSQNEIQVTSSTASEAEIENIKMQLISKSLYYILVSLPNAAETKM